LERLVRYLAFDHHLPAFGKALDSMIDANVTRFSFEKKIGISINRNPPQFRTVLLLEG
jgi:hypothetical protein